LYPPKSQAQLAPPPNPSRERKRESDTEREREREREKEREREREREKERDCSTVAYQKEILGVQGFCFMVFVKVLSKFQVLHETFEPY
jgi:hypothetical protein